MPSRARTRYLAHLLIAMSEDTSKHGRKTAVTDWTEHLTPEERARVEQIDAERDALTAERLRIYDRAKKRKQRA